MPGIKAVLQGMRGKKAAGSRILTLTPEEMAQVSDDGEVCLSVYGTLTDSGLEVSRVEPEIENADGEADSVSDAPPHDRAMPSPS